MTPVTLVRLALAGSRTDTLRVVLTAGSAALGAVALLAAATVVAVPEAGPANHRVLLGYSSPFVAEDGLRPGVVVALLLLAIPILALTGQCVRFGSPSRDRRLAAFRMAGATPGQAMLVAAVETGMAGAFGALVGFGGYLIGRAALDRPDAAGQRPLPTDVLPSVPLIVLAVLAVPLVATLVGLFLLRRVIITPMGVVRRTVERKPSVLPGFLIIAGVFATFVIRPLGSWLGITYEAVGPGPVMAVLLALVVAAVLGVIIGTGWITHTTGRVLHRFGRRPAMLLAGRHLMADPWSGSRTFAALLTALIFGGGVLGYRITEATSAEAERRAAALSGSEYGGEEQELFFAGALDLVNAVVVVALVIAAAGILVVLAEGIVSRRRTYAALVANGVPRRTLGEAIAWQTLAPLVPAIAVALTVGLSLIRVTGSTTVSSSVGGYCSGTPEQCASPDSPFMVWNPAVTLAVPVPVNDLLILGGGTLAVMLGVVGIGLLLLRMSTDLEEIRVG